MLPAQARRQEIPERIFVGEKGPIRAEHRRVVPRQSAVEGKRSDLLVEARHPSSPEVGERRFNADGVAFPHPAGHRQVRQAQLSDLT
jgi:hypothetical protein